MPRDGASDRGPRTEERSPRRDTYDSHRARRGSSSEAEPSRRRRRSPDPRSRSPLPRRRHRSRSDERDSHHRRRSNSSERDSHRRHRSDRDDRRSHRRHRSPRREDGTSHRSNDRSPVPHQRSRQPLPSQAESFGGPQERQQQRGPNGRPIEKEKPNFRPSGALAAASNKVTIGTGTQSKSVVLKYHEPSEARKPPASEAWALYVFKEGENDPVQTVHMQTQSCWLLGREPAVADVLVEHPSCSKQHAVLQFRNVVKTDEFGEEHSRVKLYLLDLESANGTKLNGRDVQPARYVECRTGDIIMLGESTREYVLLLPPKG